MAPSLQEVEDLLIRSYKEKMNQVMAKSYLTFLETCDYHRALSHNILLALDKTLPAQASAPYRKHMNKALETQLHVSLLKRKQKVQTMAGHVEQMTQEAVEEYHKFLEKNRDIHAEAIEKKELAGAFKAMTDGAKAEAVRYFKGHCHFSTEKALLVALRREEEDFLEEFKEKYGDFEISCEEVSDEDEQIPKLPTAAEAVEEPLQIAKVHFPALEATPESSTKGIDVIDTGEQLPSDEDIIPEITDVKNPEPVIPLIEVSEPAGGAKSPSEEPKAQEASVDENPPSIQTSDLESLTTSGQETPTSDASDYSTSETLTLTSTTLKLRDLVASQLKSIGIITDKDLNRTYSNNPAKPPLQHTDSDTTATSGFVSRESSLALDTITEQPTIKQDSHWWTVIGNVSRRGSENYTEPTIRHPFQTISPSVKSSSKPITRLVILIGSTKIYARYFDDANGKTGKSAQTFEPHILLGHQKVIGELARKFSTDDTQNVLDLLRENHCTTLDNNKLSTEEVLAEFLRQIHLTLAGVDDGSTEEFVIIYPANLTHFQRRRLCIAADLADFHHVIFHSLHTFLAALQMTCEGIHDSNTMILHFNPKAFDVVIAHLDSHRPTVASYTGAEDLANPGGFHKAHKYLIHYAETHGEELPVGIQKSAGRFYKEIISKSLEVSNLDWSQFESILVLYDPPDLAVNLEAAFDSPDMPEDINAIEIDETEVLNAAMSEATFEQAAEIQDIHPRNFGVIFNGEFLHFYQEKNTEVEEEELLKFKMDVCLGSNKIAIGSLAEYETYRFWVTSEDVKKVKVTVKSDPIFLYTMSVKTLEGEEIESENLTFPYLCEL